VVFQATRGRNPVAERTDFAAAIGQSPLAGAELVAGLQAADWNQALRQLAVAQPDDAPSIAVIDEVPWLVEQDGEFEGALQTVWDRHLSGKPVLLVLVGSDMSVMEALQSHGRPFFGRATKMTVQPLHLADVQEMTRLGAAEAVDALLITGGFPEIVQSWRPGMTRGDFLREAMANPLSPLLVAGELTLLGEFPEASHSTHGITIERVLTDNAWAYTKTTWRDTCHKLGINPRFTRPWRPQTNGKVERFHRTLLEEWAYHRPYTSDAERQAAFPDWLDWYSYHRPHTGISGQTPASRVTNLPGQHT
jgi:hypothetical protein